MRRFWLFALLILPLSVGFFALPHPVLARDRCGDTEGCIVLANADIGGFVDTGITVLETNLDGANFPVPELDSLTVYGASSNGYGSSPNDSLGFMRSFEATCTVTNMTVIMPSNSQPARVAVGLKIDGSWQNVGEAIYATNIGSWSFDMSEAGATDFGIQAYDTGPQVIAFVIYGTCDDSGGGGGTLTRPLTSADEVDTSPLYDQSVIATLATTNLQDYQIYPVLYTGGPETVSAWSKAPGAKVHAADAGSIVSMRGLSWDDCGTAFVSPSSLDSEAEQTVVITSFRADQNQPCIVRKFDFNDDPHPDYGDIAKDEYYLDPTNGYVVTLQTSGGKIQYLVKNAPNYVVVGDTIDVGCVLGETLALTTIPSVSINWSRVSDVAGAVGFFTGGALSFAAGAVSTVTGLANAFFPSPSPSATTTGYMSMTSFGEDDSRLELASQLTVEPTNDDPCNNTGEFRDCLAFNPQFARQGDGWVASGNVEWTEPGVILDPGESITATINLSSTGDYTATAYTQGENGSAGEIRIFLGSNTQRFPAPVEWSDLQLAAEPLGAPDLGTFYSVGVQNTGTTRIQVASLCVTDGAPNTGPNSCYFNNQSFVQGTSGWTVSEGVEVSDQALNVPDDGVISQNVHLLPLPGGPATYRLVVRGDWWYNGALDYASGALATAQVQYEWPDGTGYQNMIPIAIHGNLAYGAGQLAYMADIEVSSETNDIMNLKVSTTDAGDMGVLGIRLTDACLRTLDGGPFPGQGGGGAPPPIDPSCEYISRPQNNDPAAWLQWHWAKSESFFTCDLMVLLNKMYVLGKQSYTLAGWQARYAQSTMKLWSSWLGAQFFPWFNGQLRNVAIGQVTTVYQSGGSCNDIFCVLNTLINGILTPINNIVNTVLGLINSAANLFLTVLTGIVGLGLAFLGRLFVLFNQVTGLFTGIIGAYNGATPATIDGLPVCGSDPNSSPFCGATWVLDNTILGGRWAVIFTIILGVASIHLILWVIGEFKSAIISTGGSA